MRQGEILPLRWRQVSLRDSQVLLDLGTTKNDEPRVVPANSFCSKEKDWLGGLDSNQDSQIQSLESYQLDDLPADGSLVGKWQKLG